MSRLSSSTLRKAAEIQEEIENLDVELRNLLIGPKYQIKVSGAHLLHLIESYGSPFPW